MKPLVQPGNRKPPLRLWAVLAALLLIPQAPAAAGQPAAAGNDTAFSAETDTVIADVQIIVDGLPDPQGRFRAMAQSLIRIRPGDPFRPAPIEAAIAALDLSRRFAAVHVDAIPGPRGETLIFTVTPHETVKDIRIRGQYPLFERDILNQMTIYPGGPFSRAELSDQAEAIVRRYQREGFIDPRVSITVQRAPQEELAVILVQIDKGPHYRLRTLTIAGNQAIDSPELKRRMRVWRAARLPGFGRFSEHRLRQDLDNLLAFYRKNGFVDAELSYRIAVSEDPQQVDVTVQIREGRQYRVSFEGNQRFRDRSLRKEVVIFSEGNRNNIGVRRSIQNLRQRYRQAGFGDVRVEAVTSDGADAELQWRRLQFIIQEGPFTRVQAVEISGNRHFSDRQIQKQLLTRPPGRFHKGAFVPQTLEEDRFAVSTLYLREGFTEHSLDTDLTFSDDSSTVAIALKIDEGPRTEVGAVSIQGMPMVPAAEAKQQLTHQPGRPFVQPAVNTDRETIIALVSEKGYPHAAAKDHVAFSQDRTRADIRFTVAPGPRVMLGDVFITGNLRTAESVIRRELAVESQAPLSLQALYDGQRRLRDLDIFHSVNYRTFGLMEQDETVTLFVAVEEQKPYYVELGAGYESDRGFFGRAKVGDRNLFGWNKDLWASGEISQTGYRVETRLTEPRFFRTRTLANIGVFHEELTEFNQPFGTRTSGGSLGFSRNWSPRVHTGLNFRLERRDRFGTDPLIEDPMQTQTRTIFVTTPLIQYDSRDSFVRPTSGFFSSLGVDISKGVQNRLDDFVRYLVDARYYHSPLDRLTLAGLARIGQVLPYSDGDQVPEDQLFFLGGIRDVRGFKENLLRFDDAGNPVGGKTALVGSLEARIDLGMNWEWTTFFDMGSVQNPLVEKGADRIRSSVGIGLRYLTPIGPMGLLYGHKLNREAGESAGRFHLSIGYSF